MNIDDSNSAAKRQADMVNKPPHYQSDLGIECIDAIRAALNDSELFIAHCRATAIKYLWRQKWDDVEDMRKAIWYIQRAIDEKIK